MKLNRTGANWDRLERNKINENWDRIEGSTVNASEALDKSTEALVKAKEALDNSESTQEQLDNIIIDSGTSDAEVIQARTDGKGVTHTTLKKRIDNNLEEVTHQLNDAIDDINQRGINVLHHGVLGDGITDDTQAIQDLINNNSYVVFPIPSVEYLITDEITIPSNRTLEFIGGNHWNVNSQREVRFKYDGEIALDKAMFRASKSPVGIEPTSDTSNIKFIGSCVLHGNNKVGYGLWGAYVTNDSYIDVVTAVNTLREGVQLEKMWYVTVNSLIAKGNQGNGITIGNRGWGGVNGCKIGNLRAHGNGLNKEFTESNISGYGVGLFLGSGSTVEGIVSEMNYGPGVYHGLGGVDSIHLRDVYLEKNGIGAFDDGKTSHKWGIIIEGGIYGSAKTVSNMFLATGGNHQSIWLRGSNNGGLYLNNISGGGVIKADFNTYGIKNIGGNLSTSIIGCLPSLEMQSRLNSNWTSLYVDFNGSDNNDGRTGATAFKTIQKAIDVARVITTVNTIYLKGYNETALSLDLREIFQELTINGDSSQITGTSNNTGLTITNALNKVTLTDFIKIDRLNINKCNNLIIKNTSLGHRDSSFSGTLEIDDSNVYIESSPLNGASASNSTRNGIRLRNSNVTMINPTITGYNAPVSIGMGGVLTSDKYIAQFGSAVNWLDGSGYIVAGNRFKNASGAIILSSE